MVAMAIWCSSSAVKGEEAGALCASSPDSLECASVLLKGVLVLGPGSVVVIGIPGQIVLGKLLILGDVSHDGHGEQLIAVAGASRDPGV